ncbi:hypothetical protein L3X38_011412 [Prunus dulcis]|uniref:Uncharacterized protein n=1 Tax=Prunus dulcis TaxID=3755 RepID=A0AAD4ZFD8_PRUDU|nr:hypothetical protein L3X38_011412 [Prunus dulcis]
MTRKGTPLGKRTLTKKVNEGSPMALLDEEEDFHWLSLLLSDPSSMGHVESRVNQQGPPCKAKYSWDEAWVKLSGGPNRLMLEESADELWLGVKCHSNPELAGSLRNALKRSS